MHTQDYLHGCPSRPVVLDIRENRIGVYEKNTTIVSKHPIGTQITTAKEIIDPITVTFLDTSSRVRPVARIAPFVVYIWYVFVHDSTWLDSPHAL